MKISKLFHWLYAILMLMPIFAIGVSCLYVIFNKNAKDSYYGDTINEVEYSDISSIDNSLLNQPIYFDIKKPFIQLSSGLGSNDKFIYLDNLKVIANDTGISTDNVKGFAFYIGANSSSFNAWLLYDDNTLSGGLNSFSNFIIEFNYLGNDLNNQSKSFLIDNNLLQEITYNKYSYLDNVFYYSVDQLKNNSLFNWSRNSFLAQPITYITDLFGMDNDNIVIYLLSYWLDISIIWLVFDLVMYVPLVIHRWVDKGVLE